MVYNNFVSKTEIVMNDNKHIGKKNYNLLHKITKYVVDQQNCIQEMPIPQIFL